ncbi:hypothetical protein SteCoe_15880 [Stentor coeruleus]|uniref:C2H2-type domain-containing protein n=1 Tax=Stentor coeruleus TaxID=5963 RepID=A0A1R2C2H7_9CILI|nr:hypothetical protein SteCoe_15880 [Stentor coeruleus]
MSEIIALESGITMYCCMYADCGSEYATKFNLKRHVESVHMKLKKFKCQICGVLFSSKQSIKEHFHIHMGFMPFKCVACDKSFRQASQLSLHKRIHAIKGTSSIFVKNSSSYDSSEFKLIKVESETKRENYELPIISQERQKFIMLPSPRITI